MTKCVACDEVGLYLDHDIPFCKKHFIEVSSPELVDDLAREIYIKEWLIPNKNKNKNK